VPGSTSPGGHALRGRQCEALQAECIRDLVLVIDDVHEVEASSGAS
jgi:hypothetical protein